MLMEILNKSVTGSISIALYCLFLSLYGKKFSKKCEKRIWILIAFYMIFPFGMTEQPRVYQIKVPDMVLGEYELSRNTGKVVETEKPISVDNAGQIGAGLEITAEMPSEKIEITVQGVIFTLWVCVAGVLALCYLTGYYKMYRKTMRWSRECTDENRIRIFFETAGETGLKAMPRLRILDDKDVGPFTTGIVKNTIFVPKDVGGQELLYILKHELIHCRERDILWKIVLLAVCIVHWFNPFVWLMRVLAEQSIEKVCDSEVLQDASLGERRSYSDVIMAWVERDRTRGNPFSTGYARGMYFLKLRFANIFDDRLKRDGKVLTVGMLIGILLAGCFIYIDLDTGMNRMNKIPIRYGNGIWTDLDGDGEADYVNAVDVRENDNGYTQVTADTDGEGVVAKTYDGYFATNLVSGDLTGDGKADIVVVRTITASTHFAANISVLHMVDGEWAEYPNHFIKNLSIALEQPDDFDWGGDKGYQAGGVYSNARIIEKDGKTMLRCVISMLDDDISDDTVKCVDASYKDGGWYIECVEVIKGYYSDEQYKNVLEYGF